MPSHSSFTREALQMALMMKLRSHSEKHFGPDSSMNPVIARKLLECYTQEYALGELGLLEKEKVRFCSKPVKDVKGSWSDPQQLAQTFLGS